MVRNLFDFFSTRTRILFGITTTWFAIETIEFSFALSITRSAFSFSWCLSHPRWLPHSCAYALLLQLVGNSNSQRFFQLKHSAHKPIYKWRAKIDIFCKVKNDIELDLRAKFDWADMEIYQSVQFGRLSRNGIQSCKVKAPYDIFSPVGMNDGCVRLTPTSILSKLTAALIVWTVNP